MIERSDSIDNDQIREPQNDESKKIQDHLELYAKNLCGRIDQLPKQNKPLLLNKPVKMDKYSEVKIATLSLKESIVLQIKQENKLKVYKF